MPPIEVKCFVYRPDNFGRMATQRLRYSWLQQITLRAGWLPIIRAQCVNAIKASVNPRPPTLQELHESHDIPFMRVLHQNLDTLLKSLMQNNVVFQDHPSWIIRLGAALPQLPVT